MERWKPIPGYEHKYQVSACGGVRSENLKMDYAAGVRRTPANFIGARWRA